MRRDDDLIRLLMMDLETSNTVVTGSHSVPGYTEDQVAYHLALILKSGFAEGPEPRYASTGGDPTIPAGVMIKRLTSEGHDFIANLRDETIWKKVKERTVKVGGSVSLELLKQLSSSVMKQALGLD